MGTFKNLDKLLDSFTQGSIPGCACVVMQNHDILYESYSGFADIEKGTKIRYMISCRNGKILPNMCSFRGAQPRWFLWSIPLL